MINNYEDWWYNKILKGYSKVRNKRYETLWLCKTLKKLMFLLDTTNDTLLVKNSLIILLNLIGDFPIDRFENKGKNIKSLTQTERAKLKQLLKDTLANV